VRKLTPDGLLSLKEYERERAQWQERVSVQKKHRRKQLGPDLTILFQSRQIILFELQEMLRAERLVKDEEIQAEMDVYNALLPDTDEVAATVFLEITKKEEIKPVLHEFIGLTDGNKLWFEFENGEKVFGECEQGRSTQDKISSVHYVRFKFDENAKNLLQDKDTDLKLVVDHKDYHHELPVERPLRDALIEDVTSED